MSSGGLEGLIAAGAGLIVIAGTVWRVCVRPAVKAVGQFVQATEANTTAIHDLTGRVSALEETTRKASNGHG